MDSPTADALRAKFESLKPVMDERTRRLWAATEARAIGRGGITRVSEATGMSQVTIRAGLDQLVHAGTARGPKSTPRLGPNR